MKNCLRYWNFALEFISFHQWLMYYEMEMVANVFFVSSSRIFAVCLTKFSLSFMKNLWLLVVGSCIFSHLRMPQQSFPLFRYRFKAHWLFTMNSLLEKVFVEFFFFSCFWSSSFVQNRNFCSSWNNQIIIIRIMAVIFYKPPEKLWSGNILRRVQCTTTIYLLSTILSRKMASYLQ